LVSAEKVTYNGYSVLRMQINDTNLQDILSIAEQYNLDIWAKNAQDKWMDIMIPPNQEISNIIKQHNHVVSIKDVEDHLQSVEGYNATQKRQTFFDYFPPYADVLTWLNSINSRYPSNTQLINIGTTSGGNAIRGIRIYQSGGTKRTIFIQGGIHAREWITVTTALYIVQEIFKHPNLLAVFDFYILPVLNVDGYIYSHTTARLWRKNRQSVTGSTCIGTDLNRNYAYAWGRGGASSDPCAETFMGRSAHSAPEVAAVTAYLTNLRSSLAFFLDIHCYGAMWMSPWGYTYDYPPRYPQLDQIMQVARSSVRAVNGNTYAIGTSANVIYIAAGGSDDWAFGSLDVTPSFTVEIFGNTFQTPTNQIVRLGSEILNGVVGVANYLATSYIQ